MDKELENKILNIMAQNPDSTSISISQELEIPDSQVNQVLNKLSDTREKILIVDDEMDTLLTTKRALEIDGYNVIEANDGKKALEIIRKENPDIILLDLMLPEMDGFDVCKKVKTDPLYGHIPIIMLTAKGEIKDKVDGIEIGADDYVTKPFNLSELKARIKMILRRVNV
ncbi:response regulator transcription factor [Methanosalsum natronophilum]|uniref:response regulator transcription factor n=1 Tax=Methanosalsum natronophilum TaxID=768733 RepID=UPI0021697376|nr:response regulator [Methanosalsum natronophilum]MCS3923119.1 two-component system alkaline phosphatase synthesis response regulator PhoP [Methanosalsum natronophilum]